MFGFIKRIFIRLLSVFCFYLVFFPLTFTIHRTAEVGEGYHFNSSLPLAPPSQTLRH